MGSWGGGGGEGVNCVTCERGRGGHKENVRIADESLSAIKKHYKNRYDDRPLIGHSDSEDSDSKRLHDAKKDSDESDSDQVKQNILCCHSFELKEKIGRELLCERIFYIRRGGGGTCCSTRSHLHTPASVQCSLNARFFFFFF